jgi:hypothetical protein
MTKMKRYEERKNQTLKIEVYYNLGGLNHFTSREEKRGYYLSVTPVERKTEGGITTEKTVAFSGVKVLVKEVKRRSQKSRKEAENLAEDKIEELIEVVLGRVTA